MTKIFFIGGNISPKKYLDHIKKGIVITSGPQIVHGYIYFLNNSIISIFYWTKGCKNKKILCHYPRHTSHFCFRILSRQYSLIIKVISNIDNITYYTTALRRITSTMMKSATKPVPRTLIVVQYSTVENKLKNMIEAMTHRLRILLCYTVV